MAQLDGFCTDRNPDDSTILKVTVGERDLGKLRVPFLVEDKEMARVLPDVFDKVRLGSICHSMRHFSIIFRMI